MKILYKLNQSGKLINTVTVDDDYKLANNETDIKPIDGLYEPLIFNGATWTGATREEWLSNQPEPETVEPSNTDKTLAALTYQQMMTTQDVTTMQTQNAKMAYQLMTAQGGATA